MRAWQVARRRRATGDMAHASHVCPAVPPGACPAASGGVEGLLRELGFDVSVAPLDSHLCCGSAGTYSVLQPALSKQLRERKLQALAPLQAEAIVSSNVGCIQHLQAGCEVPVRHWIEVLDEALIPG